MNLELETIYVVWLREVKKYFRAKERIVSSLMMPLFWFLIFGSGVGMSTQIPGVNYSEFIAPGIIAMALLFTSIFSGISVIWDREFGFLKEMLVAPTSRLAIVVGRSLGGATTALMQGTIIMLLSVLLGVNINPASMLLMLPLMLLVSIGFVSLGITIASVMESTEGFQMIVNFIVMPMFFLSGALFPIGNLPGILKILVYVDPMTYGVEAMRHVAIGIAEIPFHLSLLGVAVFSVATSLIGSYTFSRRK
ncbi:MAG: ABC transporter permease [Candidatus Aenigmatarchaeota archaeon]